MVDILAFLAAIFLTISTIMLGGYIALGIFLVIMQLLDILWSMVYNVYINRRF